MKFWSWFCKRFFFGFGWILNSTFERFVKENHISWIFFLSGRFGLLRIINCICNINRYMGLLFFFSFRTLTFMANLQPKAMWKWKTLISAHYLQTFCFQYYIYVWLHTRYIVQRKSCKIKSTHSDFRYEGNVWLFNVCILYRYILLQVWIFNIKIKIYLCNILWDFGVKHFHNILASC